MPRRRRVTAVDGIELEVDRGEVIAFIGPNGAGKSTTIKLLTGILHRDAGSVSVLGMDPQQHRRRLAYRIATVFGQKSQLCSTCRRSTRSGCWPTCTTWSHAVRGNGSRR